MNPYLVGRLQPFGTTIFAEMSALAVETGAINLGQGFPDTDGPDVGEAGRHRRDPGRPQPVPARHRCSRAARRDRAPTSNGSTGSTYDADAEILVTAGATEAIAAALLALCGPGDEVVTFEPYYDSYAACIAMSRGDAARRHVARARLRVRSRRAAGRDHAAHEAHLAQLAAQPDGQGLHPRRARVRRRARAGARSARRHRRGLRASRLRGRARADGDAARHARPHGHDRVGRQDVLLHGLEGRAGCAHRPSS